GYGNRGGHGGGYGGNYGGGYGGGYGAIERVVYEERPSYGYGPRPIRSEGNGGSASAAAAASAAAVNPGSYREYVVPSWNIDGGRGYELGRGRGGY
uniref:Chorion protein S15 n=1 Tax=Drosophila rhopaloa TaxID=1041015 RepID=A0A6P4E5Q1_DRORH